MSAIISLSLEGGLILQLFGNPNIYFINIHTRNLGDILNKKNTPHT